MVGKKWRVEILNMRNKRNNINKVSHGDSNRTLEYSKRL